MRPLRTAPRIVFTGKHNPVTHMMTTRQLKKKVEAFLREDTFSENLDHIIEIGERRVVNPLFSFLYHGSEILKWRAVTAMGMVVDHLAGHHPESARIIMRRFMWSLNDESGGIGWGSPEAMGEIMARNELMAKEYCRILISYINEDGNFLEHEMLQRGVLWGFGRVAHARPHLVKDGAVYLNPFMTSPDALKRGLAAWAAGPLKESVNRPFLEGLLGDDAKVEMYLEGQMRKFWVEQLAKEALKG